MEETLSLLTQTSFPRNVPLKTSENPHGGIGPLSMLSDLIGRTCDDGMRIRDGQIFCSFRRASLKTLLLGSSLSSA